VLEAQFPDICETQPELLAHHYTEASLVTQAIPYWQQAGQQAIQRSANLEAAQYLTKGLALLATLPETPVRAQQELALQLALGLTLIANIGRGSVEVQQVYRRADELCQQVGDTPQRFQALWGLFYFYLMRAEHLRVRVTGRAAPQLRPTLAGSRLRAAGLLGARGSVMVSRRVTGRPRPPRGRASPL
jgi:hypothetical protein